jgi:DNA-binding beta-propeller fold protein YncE
MQARFKRLIALTAVALGAFAAGATHELLATCGIFTDVPDGNIFCSSILQIYYLGITGGTTATTYSPSATVTREQMAAFLARTYDRAAARTSRRAALNQWWTTTPHYDQNLGLTSVGDAPQFPASDGADIWVPNADGGTVSRVRASDGKLLGEWTGAIGARAALVAMGRVFVTGATSPGRLYLIDPTAVPGAVQTVASTLGDVSQGVAFDGTNIWTANAGGSVSIVAPGTWGVITVAIASGNPAGILFDGARIWITGKSDPTLKKLNADGSVAQTVTVGADPAHPAFDGNNIWVPNFSDNSVTVVRVSDGTVLKTFSAANGNQNGLNAPFQAAFDGQRILVTNFGGGISLFKAADLSPIGFFATAGVTTPTGVCNDGVSFWVTFAGSDKLGRF